MTNPTNRVFLMDGEEVNLDELLEANQEGLDPEELTAIAAMRPGDKLVFGGGAWAQCTIECREPSTKESLA